MGIKFYKQKLTETTGKGKPYRQNFDNFEYAFFTMFQIMTTDNW